MGGFNFSSSSFSRTRAEEISYPPGITAISIAAFNSENVRVDSVKAVKDVDSNTFYAPKLLLPIGTYTIVAVAHGVSGTSIEAASIDSPTLARLHEDKTFGVFSCVKEGINVSGAAVTIDLAMGKRKNARFALETEDIVPDGVVSIWIQINLEGTTMPKDPTFNPATGYATGNWKTSRNINTGQGKMFSSAVDLLLPAADSRMTVSLTPLNARTNPLTQYQHSFSDVPFAQNTIVRATGFLFGPNTSFNISFDTEWEPEYPLPF